MVVEARALLTHVVALGPLNKAQKDRIQIQGSKLRYKTAEEGIRRL